MLVQQKRQRLVLVGTITVLGVLAAARYLRQVPSGAETATDSRSAEGGVNAAPLDAEGSAFRRIEVTWPVELRRDFFAGAVEVPQPKPASPKPIEHAPTPPVNVVAPEITVGAILTARTPRALINGRVVGEGDRIGDARVVRILERSVEIERDSRTFVVTP